MITLVIEIVKFAFVSLRRIYWFGVIGGALTYGVELERAGRAVQTGLISLQVVHNSLMGDQK